MSKVRLWLGMAGLVVAILSVGAQTDWRFGFASSNGENGAAAESQNGAEGEGSESLVDLTHFDSAELEMCAEIAAETAKLQNLLDGFLGEIGGELALLILDDYESGWCGFEFCENRSNAELESLLAEQERFVPYGTLASESVEYQKAVLMGKRCGVDYKSVRDELDRRNSILVEGSAKCATKCLLGVYQR